MVRQETKKFLSHMVKHKTKRMVRQETRRFLSLMNKTKMLSSLIKTLELVAMSLTMDQAMVT